MGEMIRLNLGCGPAYRPGYINIDKHERSVADVIADVGDLPFKPNAVSAIEAVQLIEHFDWVHCKYVLAEWFRVLEAGGVLSLETPDLKGALKKVSSSSGGKREAAVQWLFGIDSPGLQHKGGYTFEMLADVLVDVGYEGVRKRAARYHTYAPGMRIECRKPIEPGTDQILASFRKRIKKCIGKDDSFVLIPLEACMSKLKLALGEARLIDNARARTIASLAATWNPSISVFFLEECIEERILPASDLRQEIAVCKHLSEIKFHERVLTLWIRSRREGRLDDAFKSFVERIQETVREVLDHPDLANQHLEYIMSLKPTPIEFLDLCLIEQKSEASLNRGIMRFHKGDLQGAEEDFRQSLRLDPRSLLSHWNLARIGIAVGHPDEVVLQSYNESLSIAGRLRIRDTLMREVNTFRAGDAKQMSLAPVTEYDLLT